MDAKRTILGDLALLKRRATKEAWIGFLIGCICLLIANLVIAFTLFHTVTLRGILTAQKDPAMWFLDTIPFIFAFWGQYLGMRLAFKAMLLVTDQRQSSISQMALVDNKLVHNSTHDPITGLPNRKFFLNSIANVLLQTGGLTLIILDASCIQYFRKSIGYYNGNRLMKQLALRLENFIQGVGTLAQLSDTEFGILLTQIKTADQAKQFALETLRMCKIPFQIEDYRLHLSLHAGICLSPENGQDPEALLKNGFLAMDIAKSEALKIMVYSKKLDRGEKNIILLNDLQSAICGGRLQLYYQPKINLLTKQLSVEALARWHHDKYGVINPDDFIPLAEKNDLIKDLTLNILEQALDQYQNWQTEGMDVGISVNISAEDLDDKEFFKKVSELLDKKKMAPEKLTIEITESAIMKDQEQALTVLEQFSRSGVHIAIDDFGTGHSSLVYLSKLPAHEVKIDKNFILNLIGNKNDYLIVRTVINLAHDLGLLAVAEGVADKDLFDEVKNLNCDCIQGYYFAEPLPPKDFHTWYQSSRWQDMV